MHAFILLILYRIFAGIIILLPLVLNLTLDASLVSSLIYAPVATLIALILAIYYDEKIKNVLSKPTRNTMSNATHLPNQTNRCLCHLKNV